MAVGRNPHRPSHLPSNTHLFLEELAYADVVHEATQHLSCLTISINTAPSSMISVTLASSVQHQQP